jgi:hypothetical protein
VTACASLVQCHSHVHAVSKHRRALQESATVGGRTESGLEDHAAHIESFAPSSWMPPTVPPLEKVSVHEWRDSFTALIYRLYELLCADNLHETATLDEAHARLVFLLAREVRYMHKSAC